MYVGYYQNIKQSFQPGHKNRWITKKCLSKMLECWRMERKTQPKSHLYTVPAWSGCAAVPGLHPGKSGAGCTRNK